jgi:hypothetical protein
MLPAARPTVPIVVDGRSDDWKSALRYYEDAKVALGVCHDDSSVYVCVTTSDRSRIAQIMSMGMITWFDTTGGDAKYFGAQFPLGMRHMETPGVGMPPMGEPGGIDAQDRWKGLAEQSRQIDIVGPGKMERREILLPSREGVEARVAMQGGNLVCEMKLPMHVKLSYDLALGFSKSGALGVGVETIEPDRGSFKPMGGRGEGGGMPPEGGGGMPPGGGRGRGGRGGGGMPRGEAPGMSKPLNFWVVAQLAGAETPPAR